MSIFIGVINKCVLSSPSSSSSSSSRRMAAVSAFKTSLEAGTGDLLLSRYRVRRRQLFARGESDGILALCVETERPGRLERERERVPINVSPKDTGKKGNLLAKHKDFFFSFFELVFLRWGLTH